MGNKYKDKKRGNGNGVLYYSVFAVACILIVIIILVFRRMDRGKDIEKNDNVPTSTPTIEVKMYDYDSIMESVTEDIQNYLCSIDVTLVELNNSILIDILSGIRSKYGQQDYLYPLRYYADGELNSDGNSYAGLKFTCYDKDNNYGSVSIRFKIMSSSIDGDVMMYLADVGVEYVDR